MQRNPDFWKAKGFSFLKWFLFRKYFWNITIQSLTVPQIYGGIRLKGERGRISLGKSNEMNDVMFVFMWDKDASFVCGNDCVFESQSVLAPRNGEILLGNNVFIGPNALVQAWKGSSIAIGNNTMLARNVSIFSSNHIISDPSKGYKFETGKKVTIGKNVWVGANTVIVAGVSIGENAVIGAGSIVNKDVPANTLWAGNPARLIKRYDTKHKDWVLVRNNDII